MNNQLKSTFDIIFNKGSRRILCCMNNNRLFSSSISKRSSIKKSKKKSASVSAGGKKSKFIKKKKTQDESLYQIRNPYKEIEKKSSVERLIKGSLYSPGTRK